MLPCGNKVEEAHTQQIVPMSKTLNIKRKKKTEKVYHRITVRGNISWKNSVKPAGSRNYCYDNTRRFYTNDRRCVLIPYR